MKQHLLTLCMLLCGIWGGYALPCDVQAQELAIAAASDLNFAIKELIDKFEPATGSTVKLSIGSSGHFFAQIQNRAPFDLYFSADIGYPKKLEEGGLAVPGTLYRYAVGRIVLWVPKTSPLDVEKGLELLRNSDIKKVSIANPKHAPYGRAAVSAMNQFQVYDAVKERLVFAGNISQAAQYVESGAADVGIIALSLALAPAMKTAGRYWEIPADAHPPIEQGVVVLRGSTNQKLAKDFIDFLKGEEGREIMRRYGFTLPE